ncbi:type II toxin-antitoxin system VapC family toxin [Acinetobacter soli]|uniref:type II toxin-antitoxin system VapC family toxin n=1 Tax=Acinetobacter soli TaxID=487316 RepID=UPI00125FD0CA|nr:PIN domain-containing protein [Acinetobacter soli]
MIVAIDNNVLVSWATDRDVYINLETFLKQSNATLLIPTPVIAEFLAKDLNKRRMKFMQIEHNKVLIGDFDKKAAFICGELASDYEKDNEDKNQKVKVDLQILSIAIANEAEFLLTEDNDIQKYIKALGITEIKVMAKSDLKLGLDLFDNTTE